MFFSGDLEDPETLQPVQLHQPRYRKHGRYHLSFKFTCFLKGVHRQLSRLRKKTDLVFLFD
jgi:hypothetical protein